MIVDRLRQSFTLLFVLVFFLYLFGPLIIMGITAFNSSAFPRVSPWECFSVEWFYQLADDKNLLGGIKNSFIIGLGVICLAVPLGLAGALMLTQVNERVRPWYYTIVISPILIPGVVLGISTLLFWDRIGHMFGASRDSIFYDGYFLTIIGQSTFISAYTMLVFISRLQRFDRAQEEAALDLGATHVQTFRKILLPFLKPAIASAAVLAFLASFENYNTTVFTSISTNTLTTVLASKVRYGINPSISALAVVIVLLTLLGAAIFEIVKRRELAAQRHASLVAQGAVTQQRRQKPLWLDPAIMMILLIFIAGLATAFFAGTVGLDECKAIVKEEKRVQTEKRIEARRKISAQRDAKRQQAADQQRTDKADRSSRTGTENFNNIFDTGNLQQQAGQPADEAKSKQPTEPRTGTENFNNIFDSGNLQQQAGQNEDKSDAPKAPETPRTGTENFNNIFNPSNLNEQAGAKEASQ